MKDPRADVPVYFLRHRFERRDALVRELFRLQLGAVDFQGGTSLSVDPADYAEPTAKSVIRRLKEVAATKSDCLVACDYRAASNRELLVGLLDAEYGLQGRQLLGVDIKTIRLKEAKLLVYRDWPLFAACHPQRGTFCEWRTMGPSLRYWYYEGRVPRQATALSPSQLEVLCHEWLREHRQLSHLIAPIGRGLKDVDIAGAKRDGRRIFAQVTFTGAGAALAGKAARLRSLCATTDEVILFADCAAGELGGCEIVPIREVFAQARPEVLRDLLGPELDPGKIL